MVEAKNHWGDIFSCMSTLHNKQRFANTISHLPQIIYEHTKIQLDNKTQSH